MSPLPLAASALSFVIAEKSAVNDVTESETVGEDPDDVVVPLAGDFDELLHAARINADASAVAMSALLFPIRCMTAPCWSGDAGVSYPRRTNRMPTAAST